MVDPVDQETAMPARIAVFAYIAVARFHLARSQNEGIIVTRKKSVGREPVPDAGKHALPGETSPVTVSEPGQAALDTARFPIVGIGASAGGLAAFEAFFSGMPADTDPGMAFVLVQHLAPDHKSILTELIQRHTRMQVFEVQDGMTVMPNCAYIIPPNRDMAFLGGALQLLEPAAPRGQRMPINFFFNSLAQDLHDRAFCIVLSGTGTDGTLGLRAIKAEGGLVLSQNPESAEFDGMPRSAIATGLVDYVLPPAEMPARLIAYASRALVRPLVTGEPTLKDGSASLNKLFVLLRSQTSHDFSQYKTSTVERRIHRRMALQQIETMEKYVKFAQETPQEVEALFRDLLIGVTGFFRDREAFEALEELVIKRLMGDETVTGPIRVWVPSCSTGEEAYSIAMLLAERQAELKSNCPIQIFATDIDARAIATARTGAYPASIASDVTMERLSRFFSVDPNGENYHINKVIRDMVVFSVQDVIRDPPFSRLDLISCRNLLIYLSSDLQKKLLPLFHYALKSDGFLFLGTSETIGEHESLYIVCDRKYKIFQRKHDLYGARRSLAGRFPVTETNLEARISQFPEKAAGTDRFGLRHLIEQALLQEMSLTAALVEANGDILYLHGRTGMFLEPTPGLTGVNNILRMAKEGLQHALSTALREATTCHKAVRRRNLPVRIDGGFSSVDITVKPLARNPGEQGGTFLYLVVLEPLPPVETTQVSVPAENLTDTGEHPSGLPSGSAEASQLVAELRRELKAKEEYLQALDEEMATSNEDLKSSNEEMQSINEELQSTNEELETSKEELQSVNEELATINAELHAKMADLTRANNDMNNLLAGTGIGTIFVDHDLRVVRFTPAATRVINLIHSDIGRPLGHIVYHLMGYNTLLADTQAVLDTLRPREIEVRADDGTWYIMRILPYRTLENVIEGAVLTFVDISATKKAQESLVEARNRMAEYEVRFNMAEAIVSTVREPLLVLDEDLRVVLANRAFCRTFHVVASDAIGKTLDVLDERQWDIPALRTLLGQVLPHDEVVSDFELSGDFIHIGQRRLLLNARRMFSADGSMDLILLAIEDITDGRDQPG